MDRPNLFTLKEIAQALALETPAIEGGIKAVSTDTRVIVSGDLFVALEGDNFDAHDFLGQAFEKGAIAAVVKARKKGLTEIRRAFPDRILFEVKDTLRALGDLAFHLRHRSKPQVLAITGSNGKTSTKEMLYSIVRNHRSSLKTEGNLNNLIGVPLTLLRLRGESCAIIEMGTNYPGEIGRLCEIATPNIGVITNVFPSHLEGLGSVEAVAEEKGDLFRSLSSNGIAVVNLDNEYTRDLAGKTQARKLTFSIQDPSADVFARHIEDHGHSSSFEAVLGLSHIDIHLPLPGRHNVLNALAAIAAASAAGIKPEDIPEGLATVKSADKRLVLEPALGPYSLIDDSYNSNPASAGAALDTLSGLAGKRRRVALLGDMLELGRHSKKYHRDMAQKIIDSGVALAALVGAESLATFKELENNAKLEALHFSNVDELIAALPLILKKNDYILAKGSHSMRMDKAAEAIRRMAREG